MQLELLPAPTKAPTKKRERSPEMLALFEHLRKDAADFLAAINYVNETRYWHVSHATTAEMRAARDFLDWGKSFSPERIPPAPKDLKLIKPRSPVTKQRSHCTKMLNRMRDRQPLFWIDVALDKLLTNPEYYGVCILQSEGLCTVNPGQRLAGIRQLEAVERDNELTRQGH